MLQSATRSSGGTRRMWLTCRASRREGTARPGGAAGCPRRSGKVRRRDARSASWTNPFTRSTSSEATRAVQDRGPAKKAWPFAGSDEHRQSLDPPAGCTASRPRSLLPRPQPAATGKPPARASIATNSRARPGTSPSRRLSTDPDHPARACCRASGTRIWRDSPEWPDVRPE